MKWHQTLARADIERPFSFCGINHHSYRELGERAVAFRNDLHRQSIGVGDIVAVSGAASLQTMAAMLGAWSLGATTWLCSLREPQARLDEMAKRIGAKVFLFPLEKGGRGILSSEIESFYANFIHDDAKTLLNTSGSTGQPKFVEHYVSQHFESAVGVNERMEFDSSQCWLMSLPLYHVGGLGILIRTLVANASLVVPAERQSLQETVRDRHMTHISLVATQLKQLLTDASVSDRLSQCRRLILGGGPAPSWIDDAARTRKLPIVTSYGATEMASMWTSTSLKAADISSQGAGTVLDSRHIRIKDDSEIRVKGSMLFQRYLGGDERGAFDDDGFYRSGDLGHIDDQGNLHIFGRRDNMFVSGGENIHPQEIELALLNHPLIDDAVVVSVPDSHWGERPVAFVRYASQNQHSVELGRFLRKTLPGFKIPDRFFDWPQGDEGKLKPSRQGLRQKALTML